MATDWTNAQLNAINIRDKTLLVSAAAGSGKTATLTERIIRSIIDKDTKAKISRMLIVTYTRASAADLKEKISKALSQTMLEQPDNAHVAAQFIALGSAHISTIDSFYYEVVRHPASLTMRRLSPFTPVLWTRSLKKCTRFFRISRLLWRALPQQDKALRPPTSL